MPDRSTEKYRKKAAFIMAVILLAEALLCVGAGYFFKDELKRTRFCSVASVSGKKIKKPEKEKNKKAAEKIEIRKLRPLKRTLIKELKGKEGDWSVYVKNLKSGESFSINNRISRSASIIKLFTAGAYLKAVRRKVISDNYENRDYLDLMIRESNNDAWKALEMNMAQAYGSDPDSVVNSFIEEGGYDDTLRDRYTLFGSYTTVRTVGRVLEEIYKGKYVSRKGSKRILDLMLRQTHRKKIPAGLPKGTKCANKTGELDYIENDSAIVWTDHQDYILVVMSEEVNKTFLAVPEIARISGIVYDYITCRKN